MSGTMKEQTTVVFNNHINEKIRRLQKLNEYMQQAEKRNMIIFDDQAEPGELSICLFELIMKHNESIKFTFTQQKDLELFYHIQDYLHNVLDLGLFHNKKYFLLSVNHNDEPILAFY